MRVAPAFQMASEGAGAFGVPVEGEDRTAMGQGQILQTPTHDEIHPRRGKALQRSLNEGGADQKIAQPVGRAHEQGGGRFLRCPRRLRAILPAADHCQLVPAPLT